MQTLDRAALLDDDLQDLRLRYELLEGDRKSFKDQTERQIQRNRDEVNDLRNKNKEIRDKVTILKKNSANDNAAGSELDKLEQKVLELHKKCDEHQASVRLKENKIRELQNELTLAQQSHANVDENNPLAKDLRELENKLDKAIIRYNETMSLKKIYEDIVKALQQEKLTFDTRLVQFERSLKSKKADASELESISRDANKAKEFAKAELARLEQQMSDEKRQRDKEIQQRRELIRSKKQIDEKELKKQTLSSIEAANNNNNQTSQLQQQQQQEQANKDALAATLKSEDREKRTIELEDTIRIIKQATGVTSVDEILQKFQAQADTHTHLLSLQTTYDDKLTSLRSKKIEQNASLGEMRYSGDSANRENQRTIEDYSNHLELSLREFNDLKSKFDKNNSFMQELVFGVQNLFGKLQAIPISGEQQKFVVGEDNVEVAIEICLKKLLELQRVLEVSKEKHQKQQALAIAANATAAAAAANKVASSLAINNNNNNNNNNDNNDNNSSANAANSQNKLHTVADDDESLVVVDSSTTKDNSNKVLESENNSKNNDYKQQSIPISILTQSILSPYNVRIGPRPTDLDENDENEDSEEDSGDILDRDAIKKFAAQRKKDAAGKTGKTASGSRKGR